MFIVISRDFRSNSEEERTNIVGNAADVPDFTEERRNKEHLLQTTPRTSEQIKGI